ncbi:hypothetical protein HZS_6384 [Henneguya salminicola]|nr:hypothetical protein HZS_6384 [Henneguya salminicola]
MYSVDINYYQRDFFIKLHSLYWNKYEITNGQCCSKNTLKSCDIPCDYFLEFLISGGEFVTFNMFLSTKLKEMRLYLYTVSTEYAPNSKYNISIVLNESDDGQIIDIANINPEKYSSTEALLGINLKGKYGNVDFTVSFG